MDIGLTSNLDFFLDDRNDMPTVEGARQVEQAIGIAVHDTFYNEIGTIDQDNAISRLEREARRAVNRTDYADNVLYVGAEYLTDARTTVTITAKYSSGELSEVTQVP